METLCAITLILICAGTAAGLVFNTRRITGNVREHALRQYRRLQIERLIREAAEEVTVPYWDEDEKGIHAARETIEKTLTEAGYRISFELETIYDDAGRIRGVNCRCLVEGYEYEGAGLFASVPLERKN